MRTEKDVETYLLRLNRRYRPLEGGHGTFLVETGTGMPPAAVRIDPPLVVVRVRIVLSSALELENLDFNELQATLDEIDVALAQQLPVLAKIAD